LNFKQTVQGDVVVLALSGKFIGGLDHEHFVAEIKNLIADGHVDVLVDMSAVKYVDSTGLGSLVSGFTTLKKNNGRLKICGTSDRVEDLLMMTRLKLVLDTYGTCEEALASFSR
jgi:anti-sigma B factor antagonist